MKRAIRFGIAHKITTGVILIWLIGTLSMLTIYHGLSTVEREMRRLSHTELPASAAAYEMEINMNDVGLGVLRYLDTGDPKYRRMVEEDHDAFLKFHAEYLRLAKSEKEKGLGRIIGALYGEFKALGEGLIKMKDRQEIIFAAFIDGFERIDQIIDDRIDPGIDRSLPEGLRKAEALVQVEADLGEVGTFLGNYRRTHEGKYKALIGDNEVEFLQRLAALSRFPLTGEEQDWVRAIERIFRKVMGSTRELLAIDDTLQADTKKFIELRREMDRILDDEVQVLTLEALRLPQKEADDAVTGVLRLTGLLIPLFILSAAGVALLLSRWIITPVQRLMQGTEAVGRGDLNYRIDPMGRDELADLADRFNRMVAELESTTVSKALLEANEEALRKTVASLQQEIENRRKAEAEQARLQASLRRSETMSALGVLVAGVSHEVRNPLFGISSTLDAMEARFKERKEYRRYLDVLREQTRRLSRLAQELLDYGRRSNPVRVPGAVDEAIAQAVRTCATLALQSGIKIIDSTRKGLAPIAVDASLLLRVFQNLLENAIQHSPSGETVVVEVKAADRDGRAWIECTVSDSGPGFRQEDLPRIFEPFFSHRPGGTGLGLAIVQRIVEDHGGVVLAENRPEGGAMMTVRLPACRPDGEGTDRSGAGAREEQHTYGQK